MRTTLPHILPGCVYCNFNHDPAIQCRFQPESTRFQLQLKGTNMNETCQHDSSEDCMNCSLCGKCNETLDEENEICDDCRRKGEHPVFGPVIYAYTRAQAIEDGELINLGMFVVRGQPVLDLVGIRFPVAMTSTAYHDVTGEGEGPELLATDVISQRVLYLLAVFKRAILAHAGDPTRIDFVCTNPDLIPVTLKALVGPGDNGEPVITIMLPLED